MGDAVADRPSEFAYRQVIDGMLRQIVTDGLQPGDKLPTLPEIQDRYGVSSTTARKAVDDLRLRRIVESRQGLGLFVLNVPDENEVPSEADSVTRALDALRQDVHKLAERVSELERQLTPEPTPAGRARRSRRPDPRSAP